MKHLSVLSEQERSAVIKFNEYGATVVVGFGSRASWADMAHRQDLYSDEILSTKILQLRDKVNKQNIAEDEDGADVISKVEFTLADGMNSKVEFTTEEILFVIRAARKVRKYFKEQLENNAKIAELEKTVAKLRKQATPKAQQLIEAENELRRIRGLEPVIVGEIDAPASSADDVHEMD